LQPVPTAMMAVKLKNPMIVRLFIQYKIPKIHQLSLENSHLFYLNPKLEIHFRQISVKFPPKSKEVIGAKLWRITLANQINVRH